MNENPAAQASSRRHFLKTSGSAVLAGALAPHLGLSPAARAQNSDTLRVGLVGCGGRGTGAAAQAMAADQNVVLSAMGDVFEDQLQNGLKALKAESGERVQVKPDNCFVGLNAYQDVINSGVDVVILATPPGFRPLHFKAAVEAGKHCFVEKPMATDAPGVRSVLESAKRAKEKKLAVVAGFCWRYDYARRAVYEQIHSGAVGDIRAIYATYYTSPVKPMPPAKTRPADWTDLHWQLRNWYNFVWLCGDGLVEQAVHSVDKVAWALQDVPPLKAVAVGGRQIPSHGGNIYDHFEVNYEYPNGVRAFLGCRQQSGCYNQNADYIMGTKGIATIGVRPQPEITVDKETAWRYRGKAANMYQVEHNELFASIRAGNPINNGEWMCSSTLLAIMGRMAAYTGKEITWEQALDSKEELFPKNLKWDSTIEVPPLALPGLTPFV